MLRTLALNVRTALIGAVHRKALYISPATAAVYPNGTIMTMVNVDSEAVFAAIQLGHQIWSIPLQIVATIALLSRILGASVWVGVGALAGSVLFLALAVPIIAMASPRILRLNDQRLGLLREVLMGISLVKINSWEPVLHARIRAIRLLQIVQLRRFNVGIVIFVIVAQFAGTIMPVAAFSVYSIKNAAVPAAIVFPALCFFNALVSPLIATPQVLSGLIRAKFSLARIQAFLLAVETAEPISEPPAAAADGAANDRQAPSAAALQNHHALSQKDGAAPSPHALRNINLVVPKGSLTVIVGRCGSGKSSLLAALTGQMQCVTGKTYTAPNLRVAFCTQQPWMQQCSIKDNILFGLDLDPQRLKEALRVSSLDRDIQGFPRGIDEMVGESGVNLSGGQKSRVALARAVYSHADAYILDDPLSSLDISVCSAVFEDCIMQSLKGQTRVMVMSQMHLIKYADQLLVMKDGMIVQAGTYDELCAVDGELKDLIGATKQESSAVVAAGPDAAAGAVAIIASPAAAAAAGKETGSTDIIAEEESASGAVKWATYIKFYKACGGAWRMAFLLGVLVLYEADIVITSQWLAWWSASQWDNPAGWWIARYQAIVWSSLVLLTALNLTILTCVIRASASLHEAALKGVLDAPLWWFESQTIGRIINRFSRDIDAVDQRMLAEIYQFVAGAGGLLAIAVTLAYSVPWLLCILVPMCVVYWYILRFYRATIRELKRIESTQRTPLYSFISENLGGIATIRAYGRRMDFVRKGLRLLDDSNTPSYLRFCADIWVTLRIELLASGVLFAVAMLGNTDAIKSSLLGLALTYAVALTYTCNLLLKSMANMEAELNAVERLSIYADALPRDAPPTFPTDAPEDAWPTLGHIEINNVTVVYPSRPDHPILRDLTLEIKPGKRVCIAGRTGSGKSTLLSAFLRLLECRTGTILLDGVDVARVGTRALRRGINMVPQEPFLFAGTARECLDIEGLHTDAELWSALQQVGLDAFISAQPDKLSARVEPGGENLSHGQRVLLSLARAVLAKPKVILLDESTGAMDAASERFVRLALREHFAGVTLISVVHRLHDAQALAEQYDRVLLMEDGVIAEWDDLEILMANPESKFRRLVEASGRALKDS
ncbi:P-loop containing nucleoside triphosphate hydrolase protein [Geranomyces variabilis]|nr:P-loop containing nucleoside triphosphate hydrolase protein [Geranomyces variabilis]